MSWEKGVCIGVRGGGKGVYIGVWGGGGVYRCLGRSGVYRLSLIHI